jgi:hypothetical protein
MDSIDRLVLFLVAGMVAGVLYVLAHDAIGLADEVIRRDALLTAGLLGLACASTGIRRARKRK